MNNIKRFQQFITEDRAQQNLPFEEPEYKDKSVHEHLLDAFQKLSVMDFKKYHSVGNPKTKLNEIYDKVFKNLIDGKYDDGGLQDFIQWFLYKFDPNENKNLYNDQFITDNQDDIDDNDLLGIAETISSLPDAKSAFSDEGWDLFLEESENLFDEYSSEMIDTIESSYRENTGLIDCWRTVYYNKGKEDDIFLSITKEHGGVGVYWAWDENKAEAYWGDSKGHSITLHGKVSVENVDWEQTLYRSVYNLKEESEIRMKDGGAIMIVGFNDNTIEKYIEVDEPFVVKTGRG